MIFNDESCIGCGQKIGGKHRMHCPEAGYTRIVYPVTPIPDGVCMTCARRDLITMWEIANGVCEECA